MLQSSIRPSVRLRFIVLVSLGIMLLLGLIFSRTYATPATRTSSVDLQVYGQRGTGSSPAEAPPLRAAPASSARACGLTEGFDNVTALLSNPNWSFQNRSSPLGSTNWYQGVETVFTAHTGVITSYAAANFNNTSGAGTISNWMLTPVQTLQNGDVLKFWSRIPVPTETNPEYPDRLEVRLSTAGASTNVGTSATSVGDFTTVLVTINPNLVLGGYPQAWTEYTATISGLSGPATGRFGFRYFVTNGGPTGANSNYIGVDTLSYCSEPVQVTATPMATATTGTVTATTTLTPPTITVTPTSTLTPPTTTVTGTPATPVPTTTVTATTPTTTLPQQQLYLPLIKRD